MGERPIRLEVGIFADPDDLDRDGRSVSNLCDEIDALVLSYGFTVTDDCVIAARGIDPIADDEQLEREREQAREALTGYMRERIETVASGRSVLEPEDDPKFKRLLDRVTQTTAGFHG